MGLVEYMTSELSNHPPIYGPPDEYSIDLKEARILDASEKRYPIGRLRVAVFLRDEPGVLPTVLATLRQGVRVAGSGLRVPFSVDGSFSASVDDIASFVLVIRPLASSSVRDELVRDALKAELEAALTDRVGDALYQAVAVEPFNEDAVGSTLFKGRNFVEFRFGVAASNRAQAARVFTPILRRFTSFLGERGVPIAYFYFPHDWSRAASIGVSETDLPQFWLRLAAGVDPSPTATLDIENAASDLADEYGCALCLYAPWSEKESMGEKFELVTDLRPNGDDQEDPEPGRSVVFVEGDARADLVASMLRGSVPTTIFSASMGVLLGHTVVSWVVKEDEGARFEEYLKTVRNEPRGLLASTHPMPYRDPAPSDVGETRPFWVAWRCQDEGFVIERIFRVLNRVARESSGDLEVCSINVEYAMSRVLSRGGTCAGKIKFSASARLVDQIISRNEVLESRIRRELHSALAEWEAPVSSWAAHPVVVRPTEPGEDPWAELVVSPFRHDDLAR